jgi:glycerophosphoryl diester phosphodiesterase
MIIVGHRGAKGLAPENTLAALKKGMEHHVDELEFDLRVTKDKVVILHHDQFMTDPNGQQLVIFEHDYAELKQHKDNLATFDEIFTVVNKKQSLYVEVKVEVDIKPIIPLLKKYYDLGWHNMRLASFSQEILLDLHSALPDIPTLVLERWSGIRAARRARQLNTKYICMDQKWLWWGFIIPFTGRGWKLYTYTLNDPIKAKRWAKYGLYGVVTDYPDLFDKL